MMIEVKELTKTYKTYRRGSSFKESVTSFFHRVPVIVNAVDHISFQIEEGEICGILGPNGAGKSTTIKMLCGALYPTSGEINIMGYSPAKQRLHYVKQIGAVFGQKSQLIWDIPPVDSFQMNQAIYDIDQKTFNERLDELSTLFDVQDVIHKPTRVLSLGERMKCEFIMAMLHQPKIVFLDEPTIGLDVIAKNTIREFIQTMNKRGTTFILTTHDLEDVEQLAQKIIVINHGQKVFDDSIDRMRSVLGEKKIIDLVLTRPCKLEGLGNVRVLSQPSPLELTIEVDTAAQSMSDFVHQLSQKIDFSDISIKELPMEQIITAIYSN